MKRNDSGDFCVLYVEPDDERNVLIEAISGQKKPVVILLAEQSRAFQRPEDFATLKHIRRQLDRPIVFVIPSSEHLTQQAARHGFPVYLSMDALANALSVGQLSRQRVPTRTTGPLSNGGRTPGASQHGIKKTVPLSSTGYQPLHTTGQLQQSAQPVALKLEEKATERNTMPLHNTPLVPPSQVIRRPQPKAQPPEPRLPQKPPRRSVMSVLVTLLGVALIIAALGSALVFFKVGSLDTNTAAATAPALIGHLAFRSSEQVDESSSQGIDDQLVLDLNSLPAPAAHKSYYGWLLGDHNQSDLKTILLGPLQVNKGHAHLFYAGDTNHTNLLLTMSRFLITEEDAAVTPIAPSPDQATWRFYGEFAQTPIPGSENTKHFSFLDHLRHLLAADPTLDEMELPGGLNNWFYVNTSKLLEWSTSVREPWQQSKDVGFVRRQSIRMLDYLDGAAFVAQDVPPGTPLLVNSRLATVGLVQIGGPSQDPASYANHLVTHLNGLLQAGKFSPSLRSEAADIITALNNVQHWLEQVRSDARQIVKMSDDQLRQPQTLNLINDMIDNVSHAYAGGPDPDTGQMRQGLVWLHQHMQNLATMDISTYVGGNTSIQMVQDLQHLKVSNGVKTGA